MQPEQQFMASEQQALQSPSIENGADLLANHMQGLLHRNQEADEEFDQKEGLIDPNQRPVN